MVLLLDLPMEMVTKILSMRCLSQSDNASLALVCKTINAIAVPNLYLQINFAEYMPYGVSDWPREDEVAMTYSKINLAVRRLFHTLSTNKRLALLVTGLLLEANAYPPYQRTGEFNKLLDSFAELTFGDQHLTASQVVQSLRTLTLLKTNHFWLNVLLKNPVLVPALQTAVVRRSYGHPRGIYHLMMQPNLKEITMEDSRLYDFPRASEEATSNVSHITLVTPWGGAQEIQTLVRMTKNLKSLKLVRTLSACGYQLPGAGQHCPCGTNPPGPGNNEISNVVSLAAHSLEALVVTHGHTFSPHVLDPTRMRPLRDFQHLRELKIDASMILGARACPNLHPGRASSQNDVHCQDFAGCMPQSLQKLHLEVAREQLDRDDKYSRKIVESFLQHKMKLPDMTLLAMTEVQPHYKPACRCLVKDSCYMAKDTVNSSSPVKEILRMQRNCLESGIELSYFSQRGTSPELVRTLFLFGQDPKEINKDEYDNLCSDWENIGLKL